jgi:hypothetical protein
VSRAELLRQAAECEAKVSKLSTLADKLAKAHDLLSGNAPAADETIDAKLASNIVGARFRIWSAVQIAEAEINDLRAEQARLVAEAERVA